jgi:hypothetical protein
LGHCPGPSARNRIHDSRQIIGNSLKNQPLPFCERISRIISESHFFQNIWPVFPQNVACKSSNRFVQKTLTIQHSPCMRHSRYFSISGRWGLGIALIGAFLLLIGVNQASAQAITINAFDNAADAAYRGSAFIQGNGLIFNAIVAT